MSVDRLEALVGFAEAAKVVEGSLRTGRYRHGVVERFQHFKTLGQLQTSSRGITIIQQQDSRSVGTYPLQTFLGRNSCTETSIPDRYILRHANISYIESETPAALFQRLDSASKAQN